MISICWYFRSPSHLYEDMQLKKRIDLFYGRSVEDGFGEGNVLLASSKWRHHNPYKLVP
uniref:Uncharacterized protein n=1 Tax=Zea mays TaxID=4577 RepID=B6T0R5_MAIZE|nr:hypothetical protein [Zea mays]